MMTDDEARYEDLCHLMTNAQTAARAARFLLRYEEIVEIGMAPKDERELQHRDYAKRQLVALMNPSLLATPDQLEFCKRVREEMEKWRAIYDAGWKTPGEEGFEAFDPKARPVDWEGKANPYPPGTGDHDEWDDGYNNAIDNAKKQLVDAYRELQREGEKEDARHIAESTIHNFCVHVLRLVRSQENEFLAMTEIHSQLFMLGATLMALTNDLKPYLPVDLLDRLTGLMEEVGEESANREAERTSTVAERLQLFDRLILELRVLGAEVGARAIATPYGVVEEDLYHFWHVFHEKRRLDIAKKKRSRKK